MQNTNDIDISFEKLISDFRSMPCQPLAPLDTKTTAENIAAVRCRIEQDNALYHNRAIEVAEIVFVAANSISLLKKPLHPKSVILKFDGVHHNYVIFKNAFDDLEEEKSIIHNLPSTLNAISLDRVSYGYSPALTKPLKFSAHNNGDSIIICVKSSNIADNNAKKSYGRPVEYSSLGRHIGLLRYKTVKDGYGNKQYNFYINSGLPVALKTGDKGTAFQIVMNSGIYRDTKIVSDGISLYLEDVDLYLKENKTCWARI